MISGIFAPVIPLITGAGMIKAILVIMMALGLSDESSEYYILNFIADSGFYFFPVVLAFSFSSRWCWHFLQRRSSAVTLIWRL